jgi:hypothetical protein
MGKIYFVLLIGLFIFAAGCIQPGNTKNIDTPIIPNTTTGIENKSFIIINPIPTHVPGDIFEISGITNQGSDKQLKVEIAEDYFRAKRTRKDGIFYGVAGNATIIEGTNDINQWVFNVNTTGWLPQQYYVTVFSTDDFSSNSDFYLMSP